VQSLRHKNTIIPRHPFNKYTSPTKYQLDQAKRIIPHESFIASKE